MGIPNVLRWFERVRDFTETETSYSLMAFGDAGAQFFGSAENIEDTKINGDAQAFGAVVSNIGGFAMTWANTAIHAKAGLQFNTLTLIGNVTTKFAATLDTQGSAKGMNTNVRISSIACDKEEPLDLFSAAWEETSEAEDEITFKTKSSKNQARTFEMKVSRTHEANNGKLPLKILVNGASVKTCKVRYHVVQCRAHASGRAKSEKDNMLKWFGDAKKNAECTDISPLAGEEHDIQVSDKGEIDMGEYIGSFNPDLKTDDLKPLNLLV